MKPFKISCILILSLFYFQTIYAQLETKLEFIFANLKGNSAFNTNNNSISSELGFGLSLGYQLAITKNKIFSIQPEVHVNFKMVNFDIVKYETSPIILTRYLKGSTEIDNIDAHLLFRYNLASKKDSKIYFLGGPFYSFLFGGNTGGAASKNAVPNTNSVLSTNIPYTANFSGNNFGFTLGIGTNLKLPKGSIVIDARFNKGLTNVYNSSILKTSSDEQLFLQWFSLGVGYQFNF